MKNKEIKLVLISALIFIFLMFCVVLNYSSGFDTKINSFFEGIRSPVLTIFLKFVSNSFEVIPFILISLILLSVLLVRKDFRNFLIALISLILGFIVESFFKLVIHRARPENILIHETTFSFPSAHATLSLIFFFLLIFLFRKEIKNKSLKILFALICILFVLLVGISRIYLGAHWPTDIFAGWALGLFCVSLVIWVVDCFKK